MKKSTIDTILGGLLKLLEKYIRGCVMSEHADSDRRYKSSTLTYHAMDLEPHVGKVLYQGNAPTCVAHAVAHAIQIEESIRGIRTSTPSRNWIYYYARKRHNAIREPLTGTSIRYAMQAVSEIGCPAEKHLGYSASPSKLNKRPSMNAAMKASSRMGLQYRWIERDKSMNVRRVLSEGHPVIFGTRVGKSLDRYKKGTVLHRPTETDGGHAMIIIGYEYRGGELVFKVLNSWRGREIIWMAEDYINWNKTHDLAVIDGWQALEAA